MYVMRKVVGGESLGGWLVFGFCYRLGGLKWESRSNESGVIISHSTSIYTGL